MPRKSKPKLAPVTVERVLHVIGLSGLRLSPDGSLATFVQSALRPAGEDPSHERLVGHHARGGAAEADAGPGGRPAVLVTGRRDAGLRAAYEPGQAPPRSCCCR